MSTFLDEVEKLSRKRTSEEDPEGDMLTGNDPMMGGTDADIQQQPLCPKRPRLDLDLDSSFHTIGDELGLGNSPATFPDLAFDCQQELDRLSVEKEISVEKKTDILQQAMDITEVTWMESSQDNVEPEVDSGNPLTFGINPLGDHRRRHVSDDSGYEGGDNEEDQNNGSPIKVNNPNVTGTVLATYERPEVKLEDQDQLLNVIIGPSSPNQPSELSDSSEELVPIPSVTPLMPEVNPDSKRQTRTWIYRDKSALYELKIGELMSLKFDRESHVMVFAVHSHPEHCMKTIDATNALGVMLGKKPNQYQFTSPQSCPFTASSGTNEVYYKPLEDKTFGEINGAVLKVDQILSIRPTMISANECNANQEQIGKIENVRQWKLVVCVLTELEFEDIKSNDERYSVQFHQISRRVFEERVQFVREIRDARQNSKIQRRVDISFPETPYQFGEKSSSKTQEDDIKFVQAVQRRFGMTYEAAIQYVEFGTHWAQYTNGSKVE